MQKQPIEISPMLMAAHVLTLCSVIFAQPVFDILARNPEFFVANHLSGFDIYLLVFALIVLLPACLMVPVFASGLLGKRVRFLVQTGLIFLLAIVFFLRLSRGIPALPDALSLAGSIILAGGFAVLYRYSRQLAITMGLLTPVAFIVPAIFLFNGNIQQVLGGPSAGGSQSVTGALWVEERPPIVLVVLDELPLVDILNANGDIDVKRFPNFAALASDSTWYENGTTVWITTFGAVPAIVSGTHPRGLLARYDVYPRNLFSMLEGHYELNVFESITELQRPTEDENANETLSEQWLARMRTLAEDIGLIVLHLNVPRGYARRLPSIEGQWGGFLTREEAPEDPPRSADPSKPQANEFTDEQLEEIRREFEAFRTTMSPREREAFIQSFLGNMTEEQRQRFAKSYVEKHGLIPVNIQEQRRRVQAHFQESREEFFRRFIDSIKRYPEASLHFVHVGLPHPPLIYLPSGKLHTPPSEVRVPVLDKSEKLPKWMASQDRLDNEHHRLRLQTAFSDRLLGELMDEMKRLGIYEKSLFIVCADHGGSFLTGKPRRVATLDNFGDVAFVPIFIKYPNQRSPRRDTSNVEIIDILPTIRDVVGAEVNWEFDGRSLIDDDAETRPTKRLPPNRGQTDKSLFTEEEYLTARREALERVVKTYSLDDPRADLFHYGKGLGLIGKETAVLDTVTVPGTIDCPGVARLSHVDRRAEIIYSGLRGRVEYGGPNPVNLHVAVSVNRTVEAITPVYESGGGLEFDVVVSEHAFEHGQNEVELTLINLSDDR